MSKRVGLRHVSVVFGKKVLYPPVWNYDNLIGTIWLEGNPSAYDSGLPKIYLSDPSAAVIPQWGGSYDNR